MGNMVKVKMEHLKSTGIICGITSRMVFKWVFCVAGSFVGKSII